MKIYNAERREFSIHISVKKFWSENFGQQSEGGKTPDDPDGHLQPDHWFKFVIDFRFRLSCHWRFIDGVVNTFSNAHYSQTPHPNWTKPTQGASGNVRISFWNNLKCKSFKKIVGCWLLNTCKDILIDLKQVWIFVPLAQIGRWVKVCHSYMSKDFNHVL